MSHVFTAETVYEGGLSGQGRLKGAGVETFFSAPKELGGVSVGTNPEELFAAAAGTCFLITLSTILHFQGVQATLQNKTEVETEVVDRKPKLKSLTHYLTVIVEKDTEKTQAAIQRAESACIISQVVQANITIKVVSTIKEKA